LGDQAINLIVTALEDLGPSLSPGFLDRPISNGGRLGNVFAI